VHAFGSVQFQVSVLLAHQMCLFTFSRTTDGLSSPVCDFLHANIAVLLHQLLHPNLHTDVGWSSPPHSSCKHCCALDTRHAVQSCRLRLQTGANSCFSFTPNKRIVAEEFCLRGTFDVPYFHHQGPNDHALFNFIRSRQASEEDARRCRSTPWLGKAQQQSK
jgi:hypothetical protein